MSEELRNNKKIETRFVILINVIVLVSIAFEVLLHYFLFNNLNDIHIPILLTLTIDLFIIYIIFKFHKFFSFLFLIIFNLVKMSLYTLYTIYYKYFDMCFNFNSLLKSKDVRNATSSFSHNINGAILNNIKYYAPYIAIALVLLIYIIIVFVRSFGFYNKNVKKKLSRVIICEFFISLVFSIIALYSQNNDVYAPRNLIFDNKISDLAICKLGVPQTLIHNFKDIYLDDYGLDEFSSGRRDFPSIYEVTNNVTGQVLDEIDDKNYDKKDYKNLNAHAGDGFKDLAIVKEEDKYIDWLNFYMANNEASSKNKYTGMFKNHNVISILAESFSPYAVDEKLTPTLYKLVNSGFVFNNFYENGYNFSSDGDYQFSTGLLTNGQCSTSLETSKDRYMPMISANMLKDEGYVNYAFHPFSSTYYDRDIAFPNWGYKYFAEGTGLEFTKTWPASDLEMVENSVDKFIDKDKFNIYYISISAHREYEIEKNAIVAKNYDLVKDLRLSEDMKGYLAANIEIDKAVEYLINKLKEHNKLDNTLICLTADHFPYGIKEECRKGINENTKYEEYKNHLVIWNEKMKDVIKVEKVCSNIDIAPTICNLLGIDYDSRLFVGRDILSSAPGMVIFANRSFITDYITYDSVSLNYKLRRDVVLPKDYIDKMIKISRNMFNASCRILINDYYGYLKRKNIEMYKVNE